MSINPGESFSHFEVRDLSGMGGVESLNRKEFDLSAMSVEVRFEHAKHVLASGRDWYRGDMLQVVEDTGTVPSYMEPFMRELPSPVLSEVERRYESLVETIGRTGDRDFGELSPRERHTVGRALQEMNALDHNVALYSRLEAVENRLEEYAEAIQEEFVEENIDDYIVLGEESAEEVIESSRELSSHNLLMPGESLAERFGSDMTAEEYMREFAKMEFAKTDTYRSRLQERMEQDERLSEALSMLEEEYGIFPRDILDARIELAEDIMFGDERFVYEAPDGRVNGAEGFGGLPDDEIYDTARDLGILNDGEVDWDRAEEFGKDGRNLAEEVDNRLGDDRRKKIFAIGSSIALLGFGGWAAGYWASGGDPVEKVEQTIQCGPFELWGPDIDARFTPSPVKLPEQVALEAGQEYSIDISGSDPGFFSSLTGNHDFEGKLLLLDEEASEKIERGEDPFIDISDDEPYRFTAEIREGQKADFLQGGVFASDHLDCRGALSFAYPVYTEEQMDAFRTSAEMNE